MSDLWSVWDIQKTVLYHRRIARKLQRKLPTEWATLDWTSDSPRAHGARMAVPFHWWPTQPPVGTPSPLPKSKYTNIRVGLARRTLISALAMQTCLPSFLFSGSKNAPASSSENIFFLPIPTSDSDLQDSRLGSQVPRKFLNYHYVRTCVNRLCLHFSTQTTVAFPYTVLLIWTIFLALCRMIGLWISKPGAHQRYSVFHNNHTTQNPATYHRKVVRSLSERRFDRTLSCSTATMTGCGALALIRLALDTAYCSGSSGNIAVYIIHRFCRISESASSTTNAFF